MRVTLFATKFSQLGKRRDKLRGEIELAALQIVACSLDNAQTVWRANLRERQFHFGNRSKLVSVAVNETCRCSKIWEMPGA